MILRVLVFGIETNPGLDMLSSKADFQIGQTGAVASGLTGFRVLGFQDGGRCSCLAQEGFS